MLNSNQPEPELLRTLLQPLLEDFQYWFERSRHLLETEDINFLAPQQQSDLLERVKQAQQEVNSAHMLFQVTGGQVGIDMAAIMPWHHLLTDCWKVAMRFRAEQPDRSEYEK